MKSFLSIKKLSDEEKPREKMIEKGKTSLSSVELLAIIISSGTRNRTALDLSRELINLCDNKLGKLSKFSIPELCRVEGIGRTKAVTILAALELANRKLNEHNSLSEQVRGSKDAYELIRGKLEDLNHEEFWIMTLNIKNLLQGLYKIGEGGITATLVDQRKIFKLALDDRSTSIVLFHNHPSGTVLPSEADNQLTRKLKDAGNILDIKVVDHIIVGHSEYYSYADQGML